METRELRSRMISERASVTSAQILVPTSTTDWSISGFTIVSSEGSACAASITASMWARRFPSASMIWNSSSIPIVSQPSSMRTLPFDGDADDYCNTLTGFPSSAAFLRRLRWAAAKEPVAEPPEQDSPESLHDDASGELGRSRPSLLEGDGYLPHRESSLPCSIGQFDLEPVAF